jgi:hypothetical protein
MEAHKKAATMAKMPAIKRSLFLLDDFLSDFWPGGRMDPPLYTCAIYLKPALCAQPAGPQA